jgi:hypothetical protein
VKASGQKGRVDGGVDVLDAGVGHDCDRWSRFGGSEILARFDETSQVAEGSRRAPMVQARIFARKPSASWLVRPLPRRGPSLVGRDKKFVPSLSQGMSQEAQQATCSALETKESVANPIV